MRKYLQTIMVVYDGVTQDDRLNGERNARKINQMRMNACRRGKTATNYNDRMDNRLLDIVALLRWRARNERVNDIYEFPY